MIYVKFVNLISILMTCSYIGYIKAKTFEKRVIELNQFQNALVMFKSKIEFTYEPINSIFADISKVIYLNEENIFYKTINCKEEIYSSWIKAIDETRNNLNKEDKDVIKMFGKMLGKTDISGQVNEICLTQSLVEKQIQKAEEEKNKNMKLYKTMGVVCGMGICIILI